MLNPINVLVFDFFEIWELYAEKYGAKEADKAIYDYVRYQLNPTLAKDGIVSLYLPIDGEKSYYSEYRNKLANIIVENSDLKYGDTAYIMY
jgi:hypothetical protein